MIRTIMSKLYEKEEYLYAPEWMTVDYTWWNKPKQFKADGMNIYDWGECLLAVEHENDPNDWTYELAKIDAVRAKTRIVIGYGKKERNRADEIKIIEEQGNYMKHLRDISEDAGETVYVFLLNSVFDETGEDPFGVATYCLVKKEGKGFVLPS